MQKIVIVRHNDELDRLVTSLITLLGYEAVLIADPSRPLSSAEDHGPVAIMVDADHPSAGDPAFLLAAQRGHVAVLFFSASLTAGELRRLSEAHGVGHFLLPNGPRMLATAIADAQIAVTRGELDDPGSRIARWARLVHHQERVKRHATLMARISTEVEEAVRTRRNAVSTREAVSRAVEAVRKANEQLRAEVTRYVARGRDQGVSKADLVCRVAHVVHDALDASVNGREASAFEAQVEQWCTEAYESAA